MGWQDDHSTNHASKIATYHKLLNDVSLYAMKMKNKMLEAQIPFSIHFP